MFLRKNFIFFRILDFWGFIRPTSRDLRPTQYNYGIARGLRDGRGPRDTRRGDWVIFLANCDVPIV